MTPGFYSQLEISQIIITQALRHHATPQITPGEVCVSLEQAITNTPLAWNVNTNIIITQLFHSAPSAHIPHFCFDIFSSAPHHSQHFCSRIFLRNIHIMGSSKILSCPAPSNEQFNYLSRQINASNYLSRQQF